MSARVQQKTDRHALIFRAAVSRSIREHCPSCHLVATNACSYSVNGGVHAAPSTRDIFIRWASPLGLRHKLTRSPLPPLLKLRRTRRSAFGAKAGRRLAP